MRFLFSTGSLWSYSIERCVAFAAQTGFDGIELVVDQRWDTRQPDFVRRLIERYGQPVVAIHSPFFVVPGWPVDEPGRIRKAVELAERLGAAVLVHHLPLRLDYVWVRAGLRFFPLPIPLRRVSSHYRRWLERDYPRLQANTAVTLCIENMPARPVLGRRLNLYHWNTPTEILRFPALTLDTTHLGTWDLEPVEVYPHLNGQVRHVHLSNFDGREHRRPESGHLRLDALLARMAADGYQGAITLELHPDALDAGSPDAQVVERLGTSLAHCRRWAGQPTER
ncbi:MAG: sugar phosphate isomerase/epimerase [Ardenticatenaceae bacterium]|nr:sugar phosphate isomerase/epimerase [Ardenticatenaceae bacterium]